MNDTMPTHAKVNATSKQVMNLVWDTIFDNATDDRIHSQVIIGVALNLIGTVIRNRLPPDSMLELD